MTIHPSPNRCPVCGTPMLAENGQEFCPYIYCADRQEQRRQDLLAGVRAGLEAAAQVNIDRAEREWVPASLWDNIAKDFAKAIRRLDAEKIAAEINNGR